MDEAAAAVVRRIFALYLEGNSFDAIAHLFNAERVPPPRAKTLHRRKGWVATSVRSMLKNRAYVGEWSFKTKEWRKLPGTNRRRYSKRPESEVIRRTFPERRIIDIDPETWEAVQNRMAAVSACYTKTADGKPKGVAVPGKRTTYPLSGILYCGTCGGPMIISGGSSRRYYNCGDARKRGICQNKLTLREDVAKGGVLGALRERFGSPSRVLYLRKKLAERLGEMSRKANAELEDRRARLARTEERIHGLVRFISEGDHSDYVRTTLKDLEVQAKTEKAAIKALLEHAAAPIKLPAVDLVVEKALALERMLLQNPTQGREQLRRLFEGGRLTVHPQPDGTYITESIFFPLKLLSLRLDPEKQEARRPSSDESPGFSPGLPDTRLDSACSSDGCAGRI